MAEETQVVVVAAAAAVEVEKPVVAEPPAAADDGEVELKKVETREEEEKELEKVETREEEEKELETEEEEEELKKAESEEEEEDAATTEAEIPQSESFKEETNVVSDLVDPEKKALEELKTLIHAAIANNEFVTGGKDRILAANNKPTEKTEEHVADVAVVEDDGDDDGAKTVEAIEETVVSVAKEKEMLIWGVPLAGDQRSDTILLKFLRARDFKVNDAFTMIKDTVIWREGFGIEKFLEEKEHDFGFSTAKMEKVVFMRGKDKEGHPVCYNVYGEFQDKEMYQKAFGDEEKRRNFLRWRVLVLEKEIREKLDFSPEGVCTMVQVMDLKNSSLLFQKKELRLATKQALALLQDNYPEFIAKQVFINVPWWYLALNKMISPFVTQRTKSKFVVAGPGKSADTLFKYIAAEQVPVQYGGLSTANNTDFNPADAAIEIVIKPSSKHTIEIPVSETSQVAWELRVLGWEVKYKAEFVPNTEGGYTVIIQKTRKFTTSDEAVLRNNFNAGEPGKILIAVDNATSKKKKLLYRFKTKSCNDNTI